ncbi:DOK2 protein, partial [Rhinopomastus cyanomelas]|nr:DOK2 protein [Rhinopomastus cyanomelas]
RMEEAVVKQGGLYLQLQQTFGKKWKRFWGVLYRESPCSSARLELFEGSAPPAAERLRKGDGGRRLLRLSDCVHVAEASGDVGCPKDTVAFLLETTDKRYLLASDGAQVASWIQKLCELAFPVSREEQAVGKDGQLATSSQLSMEENSLYSSGAEAGSEKAFGVTVRATEASQRCQLRGRCILRAGDDALELQDLQTLEPLYRWPYRFLRRFGRDQATFSFEAGRRCVSGEGSFEFDTSQGNEIFQAIESAIGLQRPLGHSKQPSWGQGHEEPAGTKGSSPEPGWEGKKPKAKAAPARSSSSSGVGEPPRSSGGAECLYAEPCRSPRRGAPAVPEKSWRQDALPEVESEYAVPFDTVARSFAPHALSSLVPRPVEAPDPVYDRIGDAEEPWCRPTAAKPDHIYDEPEGLSPGAVYDEPEEVKGDAWRLQAAPEEPPGHQHPYNPQRDDYAVPKRPVPLHQPLLLQGREWLGANEYDNVALKLAKK